MSRERRLSKIETLTLAKNYIVALTDVICRMRDEEAAVAAGQQQQQGATRQDEDEDRGAADGNADSGLFLHGSFTFFPSAATGENDELMPC